MSWELLVEEVLERNGTDSQRHRSSRVLKIVNLNNQTQTVFVRPLQNEGSAVVCLGCAKYLQLLESPMGMRCMQLEH